VSAFVPDYQRVAEDIRRAIRDGRYRPGDQLPIRRVLIAQYGVSGQTIDSAMLVLKAEGWVRGHQGRGTFVAEAPPVDRAP
jgi:DNA-binding GntR family transcriptional regulator